MNDIKPDQRGITFLADDIIEGKRILFITGAGLSVASGISTYRSEKNSIWNRFVMDWGTREKFQENPLLWWNKFWLRTHEKPEFLDAKPNRGHFAIARITHRCNAKIITQNIDRLHGQTLIVPHRLAEVHGRLGMYKCIAPKCKYAWSESITHLDLDDYAVEGTSLAQGNLELKKAPTCPACRGPILPQSLLFDEMYESHSFYNWDSARQWMKDSDVFVFVGTSFSVGITAEAINVAEKYKKTVYNFNLQPEDFHTETFNILGRSEETLPLLYNTTLMRAGKPRLYFYPLPTYDEEDTKVVKYSIPSRMIEGSYKRQKTC